jgi:hypothetical protein
VEGDALDEAGQDLGWRACPLRLRHHGMMAIRVLGRYRDQAGTVCQPALTTVGRGPKRRAALGSTESARSRNIEPSRPALLLVAGIADGRSEKPGFSGLGA